MEEANPHMYLARRGWSATPHMYLSRRGGLQVPTCTCKAGGFRNHTARAALPFIFPLRGGAVRGCVQVPILQIGFDFKFHRRGARMEASTLPCSEIAF